MDKLGGDYTATTVPLGYTLKSGMELDFHYAIDLVTDLAAILLECKVTGSVNLLELDEYTGADFDLCITTTQAEDKALDAALARFAAEPLAHDLSEMAPQEDMKEMAAICEELRRELRQTWGD